MILLILDVTDRRSNTVRYYANKFSLLDNKTSKRFSNLTLQVNKKKKKKEFKTQKHSSTTSSNCLSIRKSRFEFLIEKNVLLVTMEEKRGREAGFMRIEKYKNSMKNAKQIVGRSSIAKI